MFTRLVCMKGGNVMAKTKCEFPYTKKIETKLKKDGNITTIVESVLNELKRIEKIRDSLFKSIEMTLENGSITEEYTNKAKATNEVINPAIKEYKSYSQRFNDLTKTLSSLTKIDGEGDKTIDPFEQMRNRRAQNVK